MTCKRLNLWLHVVVGALLLIAGAIEGKYGKSELFGDDISYLDVTNMIRAGDWKAALNPLWSTGYPFLLSVVRPCFALGSRGELAAAFCLNLSIYAVTWAGFLWFLSNVSSFIQRDLKEARLSLSPFLVICAACIFVTVEVLVGRVSTIGPDQVVTCLFFFASGLTLRLISRPTISTAAWLGAVLGVGFLSKQFFLPLSCLLIATAILSRPRRDNIRPILTAVGVMLVILVPYGLCLSWAVGRYTLGGAGTLNYAFHVNHLPHWMGWQGGPGELGVPVHPVQILRDNPPVFAFGEPFHVTYPPQFAMVYWYQGYHQFFNVRNAIRAVAENLRASQYVFEDIRPVCLAVFLCACLVFCTQSDRAAWLRRLSKGWPWYLPAVLGILLYVWVHLEGRYITGFLAVLAMMPFLALDHWRGHGRAAFLTAALIILVPATVFNICYQLRGAVSSAVNRVDMQSEGQWKVAQYLRDIGLKEGDRVASVSPVNDFRCTWAYAMHLRIVAAIGNDAYDPDDQLKDLHLFFDDNLVQQQVLQLFRKQGAVAVVATQIPFEVEAPGWQRVPGSNAWVFNLIDEDSNGQAAKLQSRVGDKPMLAAR